MRCAKQISTFRGPFCALLLLTWLAGKSAADPWVRLGLPGGGVAENQQLLLHDEGSIASNELWSACMDDGPANNNMER